MTDLESTVTPTTPVPEAQTTTDEKDHNDDGFDTLSESWQKKVRELREDSKKYRREKNDLSTKLSTFEQAEQDRVAETLTDIQKAQNAEKNATDRATALEQRLIQRDAYSALDKANVVDAELAFLAIKDKINVENGEVTNLDTLITDLLAAKPHLVKNAESVKPVVPDTKSVSTTTKTSTASKHSVGRL